MVLLFSPTTQDMDLSLRVHGSTGAALAEAEVMEGNLQEWIIHR